MSGPVSAALVHAVDAATSLVVWAAQDPVPSEDQVRPGWIALGLMVLMCVATFLLWMNMRKQIKKIDFVEEPDPTDDEDGDGADHPTPSGGSSA